MRLFAGIYPPEEACAHLAAYVRTLHVSTAAVNTRLAPRAQWHVTLVFLGEVPDDRLPDVDTALREATPPGGTPSARLRVAGGGRFGRGRFTILWAGLSGEVDRLTSLARDVRQSLKRARLPFDDKPFRPHLTLARPGDRIDRSLVAADHAALDAYRGPEWPAGTLRLMRSRLGPSPVYTEMGRYDI
ncbi:RNA 2',3'-cyclic phosphodiesterase [Catenuloplanes indicus]|uniref:RNA 2',3'-cyclic phosphodiesterase n=1 Tax=Catenuloplanes indicus TaxID=137267 RepID=A0AAE3W0Z4_9ACTN|nr:RNA 2',3'-cyclic phosphodiesterase [Catenuloplanes indicus]MDQ0367325.1 2'-5' RNA ligase [Catenuloplanes indicus]